MTAKTRTFGPATLTLEGLDLDGAAYIVTLERRFREALAAALVNPQTSEDVIEAAAPGALLGAALLWCLDASDGGRPKVREVLANTDERGRVYAAALELGATDADLRELARAVAAWAAVYLVTPLEQAPARAGFFAPPKVG